MYFCSGDMAEWSIAAVLKTVKPKGFGGSNSGDMAEWSIAAVLKTVKPKGFGGSNPSVSARAARVAFIMKDPAERQ